MKQAGKNNKAMAAILEDFEKKLEFLAKSEQDNVQYVSRPSQKNCPPRRWAAVTECARTAGRTGVASCVVIPSVLFVGTTSSSRQWHPGHKAHEITLEAQTFYDDYSSDAL